MSRAPSPHSDISSQSLRWWWAGKSPGRGLKEGGGAVAEEAGQMGIDVFTAPRLDLGQGLDTGWHPGRAAGRVDGRHGAVDNLGDHRRLRIAGKAHRLGQVRG